MLIAHEAPISIMPAVRQATDYDYCLVHLCEQYPQYFEFFQESLAMGRKVVLDNSLFELREKFDPEEFAKWIDKLRPTYYVIPDVWENCDETIKSCYGWMEKYKDVPGKTIGVVQATTYEEAVRCYSTLANVDKVAFNFENIVYSKLFPHPNKRISLAYGRIYLLSRMIKENVINQQNPHHLLGINLPQEVLCYKQMPFIESIDTSNPVIHGLLGYLYEDYGLLFKKEIKLADLICKKPSVQNFGLIMQNITKFRHWANGEV